MNYHLMGKLATLVIANLLLGILVGGLIKAGFNSSVVHYVAGGFFAYTLFNLFPMFVFTLPQKPNGEWYSKESVDKLVREMDWTLNGPDAAPQAMLCDIVKQVKCMSRPLDIKLFDLAWDMVVAIRGGGPAPHKTPTEAADKAADYLLRFLDVRNAIVRDQRINQK